MPQTIHRGIKSLIDEANAAIETVSAADAIKAAQDMGLKPVAHMGGGFAAWRDAGGPIEKWEPKKKG